MRTIATITAIVGYFVTVVFGTLTGMASNAFSADHCRATCADAATLLLQPGIVESACAVLALTIAAVVFLCWDFSRSNQAVPFFASTRRVGGLRFVKLGRICFSFCVTRAYRPL